MTWIGRRGQPGELEPEQTDPRAGVEDDRSSVLELQLDARGVAAEGDGLGSGRRERATAAPDGRPHSPGISQ